MRAESAGPERFAEIGAIHMFHEQVAKTSVLSPGSDSHDVGVIEPGERSCLAFKPFEEGWIRDEFRQEDLQRAGFAGRPVPDPVDKAHGTGTEEALELESWKSHDQLLDHGGLWSPGGSGFRGISSGGKGAAGADPGWCVGRDEAGAGRTGPG